MGDKMDGYWTVAEAAEAIGVTTGRIRQMLRAGGIDGKKLGPRMWVISDDEIQRVCKLPRRKGRRGAST